MKELLGVSYSMLYVNFVGIASSCYMFLCLCVYQSNFNLKIPKLTNNNLPKN